MFKQAQCHGKSIEETGLGQSEFLAGRDEFMKR
jgi:hypothetical protein